MASLAPHHSISSTCSTRHPYSFDTQDWSAIHPIEAEVSTPHWPSLSSEECAPPSPRTKLVLEEFFGLDKTREGNRGVSSGSHLQELKGKTDLPEEALFSFPEKDNGTDEQQIWRMTNEYLQALNSFCSRQGRSPISAISSSLIHNYDSEDPATTRQLSFVLQALELASSQGVSALSSSQCPSPASKSQSTSLPDEECHSGRGAYSRLRPIPKAKTGRKPEKFVCFLCQTVFPYKKNLIRHFQADHGIGRCQSLLYKRLRQGEELFKKLYLETEDQTQ